MSKTRVGVGIVGAGFIAATRLRCWRMVHGVEVDVVAVATRTETSAKTFSEQWGLAALELDALLARADIDVVDLCVPNLLHRSLTERVAQAGKHVICTKPLSAYVGQDLGEALDSADVAVGACDRRQMLQVAVADADAMVTACSRAEVRLMYGENWVYAPSIRRAAALLATAQGPILEMRGWEGHNGSHSLYSKEWRYTGGGALLRLGAHPIGAMLWLKRLEGLRRNGAPIRPVAVTAEVADLSRTHGLDPERSHVATGWKDVENWGCATLAFSDGSRGVAYGSDTLLGGMESKLEVYAADAHLKCNLSPTDMLRAYAPTPEVFGDQYLMEKSSTSVGWSTPMPDEDFTSGQAGMIQAFAETVAREVNGECGEAIDADGELGRDVTRVIYSAYVSAAEGRRMELADA